MGLSWDLSNTSSSTDFQMQAQKIWNDLKSRSDVGFIGLPENKQALAPILSAVKKFQNKTHIVHIGIGGSSLGPEMLIECLRSPLQSKNFYFWNNIDPEELYLQISSLEKSITKSEDVLFYIVSKSGSTAETMAHLSLALQWLEKRGINKTRFNDFILVCTDPVKSELKDFANEYQLDQLDFPSNVGGRFSVLTAVGLFPAALAGLKIERFLEGALHQKAQLDQSASHSLSHPLFQLAGKINAARTDSHPRVQTVLMPYSSRLKELGTWFVQLWAESLGKKLNLKNENVNIGLTPVCAIGATDQHSIIQLFCEGPHDKFFLLIELENFAHDMKLDVHAPIPASRSLTPYTMGQLMKAEFEGTKQALLETGAPVVSVGIEKLDEFHMGELIYFFESLTAIMGGLMGIDPFNQPGVEAGKKYAWDYLKKSSETKS